MKAAICLAVLLTGCTTYYVQAGRNSLDFERDLHECERDFAAMFDRALANDRIHRCLRMKGWREE
jgi:hypothetical protein